MLYCWEAATELRTVDADHFGDLVKKPQAILWLDLPLSGEETRNRLEALNLLHPLTISRIFTINNRAFLDEFDDYLHLLLQEVQYNEDQTVTLKEAHFIMGSNYLITIRNPAIDSLNGFSKEAPPARYFSQGPDILFYHLAEPLLSAGFRVLDQIADLTEDVEDRIFPKPDQGLLNELFSLKKDLIAIRKSIAPMREVFSLLSRRENPFVDNEALPFMSLLYDELIRLHEMNDTQREIVSNALEIYLSSMSNRMNEIMTTLTVVSTIILPLTLIVGYYGMNFRIFPELKWGHGILFVVGLMVLTTLGMLWYFKRKKWF